MTDKWIRDTGLVFALLSLILSYKWGPLFLALSALFIIVLMFTPSVLWPLARLWLAITETLGFIMGKVFFAMVFFLLIIPVGYIRRVLVGDSRDLNAVTTRQSTFFNRASIVSSDDLARPY
jgi:hypothetical protein